MSVAPPRLPAIDAMLMILPAPALRAHPDHRGAVHEERALGVHVHDVVPLRLAHLGDRAGGDDAGRVDHDIDPTEAVHGAREHGVHGDRVRDIPIDGKRIGANLVRHRLCRGVAAEVAAPVLVVGARRMLEPGKGELHALAREAVRDASADAGSAAGDEGNLPCKV